VAPDGLERRGQPTRLFVIDRASERFLCPTRGDTPFLHDGFDNLAVRLRTIDGAEHTGDLVGTDRRGFGRRERGLLDQDRGFHLSQLTARFETELVDQHLAGGLVRGERVRLPTSAIQREHQLAPQALPVRVARNEGFELREQLDVAAEGKVRVDAVFDCTRARFLQPRDLEARPRLVGEVRERRLAPQRERLPEHGGCAGDASAGRDRAGDRDERVEAEEVDLLGVDGEQVAGRLRQQHRRLGARSAIRLERLAQVRDVHLQRRRRARRGVIAPQAVDQSIGGDGPVQVEEQHRQHRPLLRPAERDRQPVLERLEHPEHPELHDDLPSTASGRGYPSARRRSMAADLHL
jgi:hypothetical protein